MPRDGSGVYSKPAGTTASPNTVIESAKFNSVIDDIVTDANAARPLTAGGTGATTAAGARDALGLEIGSDIPAFAAASGMIYGLTLSNNGSDVTNDIDIATGSAIDSTNAHVMTLGSAITKRLDAAWAVGTNQGGLDTGSIANTTYHVYLIKRLDTGVVDVIFSTSASAPTLPANYTLYRRIGSILRESAAIVLFKQVGNRFRRTPILSVDVSDPGATAVTRTLGVPTGLVVVALFSGHVIDTTSSSGTAALFSALDENDTNPVSGGIGHALTVNAGGTSSASSFTGMAIPTNTSGQIRSRFSASDADVYLRIFTEGWIDEGIR